MSKQETYTGLVCPRCGTGNFVQSPTREGTVSNWTTRKTELRDGAVRRRRICKACGRRVFTIERIED